MPVEWCDTLKTVVCHRMPVRFGIPTEGTRTRAVAGNGVAGDTANHRCQGTGRPAGEPVAILAEHWHAARSADHGAKDQ